MTNVLVLKGKNQAFLEMADEVSAAAMVACFSTNPPQVRGRTVYVQFSNHRELKTDQSHSIAVSIGCLGNCQVLGGRLNMSYYAVTCPQSASAALQNQDFQIQSPASGSPLPVSGTTDSGQPGLPNADAMNGGGRNTVLRVIVESLLYPVSLDILHQIFQRFGKVLKIVTFTKNNSFQVRLLNNCLFSNIISSLSNSAGFDPVPGSSNSTACKGGT